MQRLAILLCLAGLSAAFVACGGGDDQPTPTDMANVTVTSMATTGTAAAPTPRPPAAAIGKVEDADGEARVNDERASQGQQLRAADRIRTGAASSIDFTLSAAPHIECRTRANSELQLRPDAKTQIRWLSSTGLSYCTVERGQPPVQATFGFEPNVQIEVEGTLFGINQSTLRVVEGFVKLTAGRVTQRVGPNEEVAFSASGQPGQKQAWDGLPDDDSEMVADLQSRRALPSLTPTAAERQQSKLLKAMSDEESVLVILDSSATRDDEDFVWSYFGRLGQVWLKSENVDVVRATPLEAVRYFQTATAVYLVPAGVSPPTATPSRGAATPQASPTPGAGASTIARDSSPFYVDRAGRTWSVQFPASPQDAPAKAAFARYTRGILATGDYYDMYAPIFGQAPPYDRLLDLLQ